MNKILKRTFAIIFILFTVFVVCYIIHTAKLMNTPEISYETIQKSIYKSKNGNILILSDDNVWYLTEDGTYVCTTEIYENGALTIKSNEQTYTFQVISSQVIYDNQTEEYLWRGNSGWEDIG